MQGQLTYQLLIVFATLGWLLPLCWLWLRYEQISLAKPLLVICFFAPLLLLDELLIKLNLSADYAFLLGLGQAVPVLLVVIVANIVSTLVKPRSPWRNSLFLLPFAFFVLSFPYLQFDAQTKLSLASVPLLGHTDSLLPYYGYLFAQLLVIAVLLQRISFWLTQYHRYLAEQVADEYLYHLLPLQWTINCLFVLTLLAIGLLINAVSEGIRLPEWLGLVKLMMSFGLCLVVAILSMQARFSPMPMTARMARQRRYSNAELAACLKRVDEVMLAKRLYSRVGIRLRDVALEAKVEPLMLAQALHRQLGKNFKDYVYYYRLEHAKHMLLNSDSKASEVAQRLGIRSVPLLSDVFVRYTQRLSRNNRFSRSVD